jgi:thiol:disulfide interchange protein DsbD
VTCQVNKVTVLSRSSLKTLFDDNNVTFLTADWTRRDPAITEVLQSFGANGVPFYVYYPPKGAPRVIELPLTEARIAAAIEG